MMFAFFQVQLVRKWQLAELTLNVLPIVRYGDVRHVPGIIAASQDKIPRLILQRIDVLSGSGKRFFGNFVIMPEAAGWCD